jgi:hypothetical protein
MTEYRKHKSGREFARVNGNDTLRIKNTYGRVELISDESPIISHAIIDDIELYKPCTEREFKEQFDSAMERIQTIKIS